MDVFADLGVDKVRLTGGEPLLRRDLDRLVRLLAANPRIRDLAMTTNGVLLAEQAPALRAAGLHRVTVSLDTLRDGPLQGADPARHPRPACSRASRRWRKPACPGSKLDTVVMRGVNDDELADLIEYGRTVPPRCASSSTWTWAAPPAGRMERVVSRREMLDPPGRALRAHRADRRGDARRPPTASGCPTARVFGIISSTTAPVLPRPATAAASPPTASGTSASTPRAAPTCASRCGAGASREELLGAHPLHLAGAHAIAGPRSGWRRPTGARSCRSASSSAIRTSRCTRAEGKAVDGARRVDVRERGANQQISERRLFMQLQVWTGCPDGKPLVGAMERSRLEGVLYHDVNDPRRRRRCSPSTRTRPSSRARSASCWTPEPFASLRHRARAHHARPHLRLRLRAGPRGLAAARARAGPC